MIRSTPHDDLTQSLETTTEHQSLFLILETDQTTSTEGYVMQLKALEVDLELGLLRWSKKN